MAEFIAGMDLGIIAGGFIKFESMCIGTPFVLISLCAHQEKLAKKFANRGYGIYLGAIKNILAHQDRFKRKIEDFLVNETLRKEMFEKSRQLVDGKGSSRILEMVKAGLAGGVMPG
jgi:spore coat polysaccharide biosynthesis predicted glycosyltransferase SpsG